MTAFPPIADYAFLSDCEVSTLVAPDGSIEWLCLPRPDAPSVFGALLDRTAGTFRFGPSHAMVPDQRRYVPGTMVLETTWHTPTGWLTVHDLLVIGTTDTHERRAELQAGARRLGRVGDPAPHRELLQRPGRDGRELPAAVRLRPGHRHVELRHRGLRAARGRVRRAGAAARQQRRARDARGAQLRAHDARRGRVGVRRAVVGEGRPADDGRRGVRAARVHRELLAGLAEQRPTSRTTASGRTSSAARWRSRASATHRPGRSWPRAPPRCPRRPAANATGTTGTPGSATPRSCSGRSTAWASTGRRSSTSRSSSTSS